MRVKWKGNRVQLFPTRQLCGEVLVKKIEEKEKHRTEKSILYTLVQKKVRKMVPVSTVLFFVNPFQLYVLLYMIHRESKERTGLKMY